LLRSDGSARPSFWRTKSMYMLIGSAGPDFAAARAPADLALLEDAHLQPLAQRLASAGITFDQLDHDRATADQLAQYALIIAAGSLAMQPGMRAKVAECTNLALVGELPGALPSALHLADDASAEAIGELIETRGGNARYAWADSAAIDVSVRYGPEHTYLCIHNRQESAYNGMLAYRAAGGDVLHMQIGIGAGRSGIVMLRQDEVVGAAIDGNSAEGGWLARGLTSSMVFNAGGGGVAPCGHGLLLMAPQSGRFQIRRGAGWDAMQAYRLLLSGELIPARAQVDAAHMLVAYTVEDDCGQTDMYIVLPEDGVLPERLQSYLTALLKARGIELEAAAGLANDVAPKAASRLRAAARTLAGDTARLATLEGYAAAWHAAEMALQALIGALEEDIEQAYTAGQARSSIPPDKPPVEQQIAAIVRRLADMSGG
jgi:hypothetical protein